MGEERLTGLAILNVHRDIAVDTYIRTYIIKIIVPSHT